MAAVHFRMNRTWTIPHIWGAHCLHTHQTAWKYLDRGQRYAPKTKFEIGPLVAEFYFRFQFGQVSSFGDFPTYDPTKFPENRSTRGWVTCDSVFSIATFKPTLPTLSHCHMPSCRPSIQKQPSLSTEYIRILVCQNPLWWTCKPQSKLRNYEMLYNVTTTSSSINTPSNSRPTYIT